MGSLWVRSAVFQQLMHAIAMVHKMQRLALSSSSSMDVEEPPAACHKCTTIQEDPEEDEGRPTKTKNLLTALTLSPTNLKESPARPPRCPFSDTQNYTENLVTTLNQKIIL